MISCYVFTWIVKDEYASVRATEDVVDFVNFSGNLIAIPDHEMDIMKRIVGEGIEVEAEPKGLQIGDRVEVIKGNLMGIRGSLVKRQNRKNFLVELNHTGYSLCMEIDPLLLRSVEGDVPGISTYAVRGGKAAVGKVSERRSYAGGL